MIHREFLRRLPTVAVAALGAGLLAALPASAQLRLPGAAGASSAPPVAATPRAADFIVAVVNSEPITNSEVRVRLARLEQQLAGQRSVPRALLARQALEQLVSERAQLQVAQEQGLRADEAMVDQAEENVARQNQMDVAQFRRRLAAEGLAPASVREELRKQLVLQRLREREVESRVRVSETEVDQFIAELQASTDPAATELNLAQVLVAVPDGAPAPLVAELLAKARRLQARARAGEDFSALAREASDAPGAAASGGVMGLRTADRYPSLFVEVTQALQPGGISEVVRSGAGFHVIKVVEKRQGVVPGSVVLQSRARHILLRPSTQLNEAAARQRLADYKQRIQAGQADFAELAREHSQDGSARAGGDLGWANPGMFVPEFEEVMNGLRPGQISDPLVSRFGVHLIQLMDRREQTLGPREQREVARNLLREKKQQEAYEQWAQDVRGRAYVEMREPPQ